MKTTGRIKYVGNGTVTLQCGFADVSPLMNQVLDIELKVHKEKRSRDANAYFWTLCTQAAEIVGISKYAMYAKMLEEYGMLDLDEDGVAKWVILPEGQEPSDRDYLMPTENRIRMKSKNGNEKVGKVYLRLRGSSEYNTQEMSRLIDGMVELAKELGIDTMTPNEIRMMVERWGIGGANQNQQDASHD